MKVVGRNVLEEFIADHPEVRKDANSWLAEARKAKWSKSLDVLQSFPKAKRVNNHVIFKLLWNQYRLDTIISYNTQTIYIKRIGTHAEYDKWEF